jgi:hypothetical protein
MGERGRDSPLKQKRDVQGGFGISAIASHQNRPLAKVVMGYCED